MLYRGEVAFREVMGLLCNLGPLQPFELRSELSVEVPESSKDWANKELINQKFNQKKKELGDKYENFIFHYDIGTYVPHIATVLQVVDDNIGFNGSRRQNILSETFKYVGVGYGKDKNKHCFYYVFAN